MGAAGDFAFGQHVEILAFLLVGYRAAGAGAVVFGIVFRFVQAAAGQHQHAGENIVLAGQGGGDAVAAVSAAVAVFEPQIQRFVAADKIGGAVGAHGNGTAQSTGAVFGGIGVFADADALEGVGFDGVAVNAGFGRGAGAAG